MTAQLAPDPTPITEQVPRRKRIAIVASKVTLDQAYPPLILASSMRSSTGARSASDIRIGLSHPGPHRVYRIAAEDATPPE